MLGKCILYAISKFVFINLEDVVGVVGEGHGGAVVLVPIKEKKVRRCCMQSCKKIGRAWCVCAPFCSHGRYVHIRFGGATIASRGKNVLYRERCTFPS